MSVAKTVQLWGCSHTVVFAQLPTVTTAVRVRTQDFTLGDTETTRVHFFLNKAYDLFLSSPSKLELSQAVGSI